MRTLSLILVCIFLNSNAKAQIGEGAFSGSDRQTILTPTAASLSAYGELPVNHFRGIPNISVPIFSLNTSKLPNLNIGLSYNSETTRSTDIPDWVGQGWSLLAGGVITRVVNGIPDELTGGFIFTKNSLASNLNNYTFFQNSIVTKAVDSAPDDFYYNFGGNSGQIFLDQVVAGEIDIRTFPQKPYKIVFSYGSDLWTITTEDGTKYTFSKTEKSTLSGSYSGAPSQVTSSWYLTKIESTQNNESIDFYYSQSVQVSAQSPYIEEKFLKINHASFSVVPNDRKLFTNNSFNRTYLDSIKSKNHTIIFSKVSRTDSYSTLEKKLDKIEVKTSNKLLKSFEFEYDDCALTNCSGVAYKRLFLKSITEVNNIGGSLPPFKFEYNTTPIPSPMSMNIDHWGYYNGVSNNNSFIPFVSYYSVDFGYGAHIGAWREPDILLSQAGILTKVIYPTGGYTSLEYESHTFSKALKLAVNLNELTKRSILTLSDSDLTSGYESYLFDIDGATSKPSTLNINVNIEYCENAGPGFCPTTKPLGGPDQWVKIINTATNSEVFSSSSSIQTIETLPNGDYELRVNMQVGDPNSNILNMATASIDIYEEKAVTNRIGGGNRIKRMVTHDGVNIDNDIEKTFEYEFDGVSTGAVFYQPNYKSEGYGYTVLSSVPNRLGSDNKHVGYSKIKVYFGDILENIYQIRNFILPDYIGSFPLDGGASFLKTENLSHHYGLETEVTNYDDTNSEVSKTQNIYKDTIFDEPVNSQIYKELPYISYKSIGARYTSGAGCPTLCQITTSDVFVKHSFLQKIPWLYKSQESITTYDGANILMSTKKFFYEDYDHLQVTKTEETNSLTSEKRITTFKYAHEQDGVSGSPNYSGMATANMLSQPYSVLVEDGSGADIGKSWTEWTNSSTISLGSKWRPWKQWVWKGTGTAPADPSTSNAVSASEITHYDNYGNVLEVVDGLGTSNSYVYTDDGDILIGVFQNAQKEEVYAQSFAYENDLGDWVFKDRLGDGGTVIDVYEGKIRIYDDNGTNGDRDRILYRHPSELSGTVVWEFDVQIANSDNFGLLMGTGGSSWNDWSAGGSECAVWAVINNEVFYYRDPVSATYISAKDDLEIGRTYSFRFVMDSDTDEIEYYIDGELVGIGDYQKPSSGIQELILSNFGHTTLSDPWYIDNIRFYQHRAQTQTQEVDPLFRVPLSIKDISGSTNRFEFDNFGRLFKTYNSLGNLLSTNFYHYSLDGNTSYNISDPNYVETQTNDPNGVVKSINYLDGLGRGIQTQMRGGNKVIATETLYNDRGLPEVVSRPIEEDALSFPGFYSLGLMSGVSAFTPGGAMPVVAPVASYYSTYHGDVGDNDELYAYSYTQYEDSPLARVEKSTLPGEDHQTVASQAVTTTYGLNTIETFTTSAQTGLLAKTWLANTLNKTITNDPDGKKTIMYTDGWGQTIANGVDMSGDGKLTRSSTDLVTEFAYDARGNLVRVEDPRGLATTYTYNTLGQLIEKKLPDQDYSNLYCYDDKGRLRFRAAPTQAFDFMGTLKRHYTYTKYDELDRPIEVGERLGTIGYDTECPNERNNLDFPESNVSHTSFIKYYYDGASPLSGHTPNNTKGRLTKTSYKDPNSSYWGSTYYSYNALGLVEWVIQQPAQPTSSNNRKIEYSYDELGRMTRLYFNPLSSSSDDHYFWYYYDELGRLEKVTSYGSNAESSALTEAEYTYYADGQVEQLVLGGGAQTLDYDYTIQGWLEDINNGAASGSDQFGMTLDYANNGNISEQHWVQAAFSTSTYKYFYDYDSANRLQKACYGSTNSCTSTGDYDVTYGYDKNGNIHTIKRNSSGSDPDMDYYVSFVTGTNKVEDVRVDGISSATKQYSYDASGNVTENGVQGITSTTYDWRNLPTTMAANGSTLTYLYDAEGNRVKKQVGSTATWYVRGANGQTIAVYENGSRKFINLVTPGGEVLGTYDGSQRRYFLKDHLGTVRTTVDQNGNVDGYDDYYPFGLVMPGRSNNTANPNDNYKFTGHERDDEAGLTLDYMMARNYDPIIGRFLQIDPHSASYPNLSSYNYVANNPLLYVDPDGQDVRISWARDEEGNLETVTLSTTVVITGSGASSRRADRLNRTVERELNGKEFSSNGIGVKFDVNYEYKANATKDDLNSGDNLLNFSNIQKSDNLISNVAGRKVNYSNDGVDLGTIYYSGNTGTIYKGDHNSDQAILHETLHFIGLSDRYSEGKDWLGNRTTTPHRGFRNDIMGPANTYRINAIHINNIVNHTRGRSGTNRTIMDRLWNGKLMPWRGQ